MTSRQAHSTADLRARVFTSHLACYPHMPASASVDAANACPCDACSTKAGDAEPEELVRPVRNDPANCNIPLTREILLIGSAGAQRRLQIPVHRNVRQLMRQLTLARVFRIFGLHPPKEIRGWHVAALRTDQVKVTAAASTVALSWSVPTSGGPVVSYTGLTAATGDDFQVIAVNAGQQHLLASPRRNDKLPRFPSTASSTSLSGQSAGYASSRDPGSPERAALSWSSSGRSRKRPCTAPRVRPRC